MWASIVKLAKQLGQTTSLFYRRPCFGHEALLFGLPRLLRARWPSAPTPLSKPPARATAPRPEHAPAPLSASCPGLGRSEGPSVEHSADQVHPVHLIAQVRPNLWTNSRAQNGRDASSQGLPHQLPNKGGKRETHGVRNPRKPMHCLRTIRTWDETTPPRKVLLWRCHWIFLCWWRPVSAAHLTLER